MGTDGYTVGARPPALRPRLDAVRLSPEHEWTVMQ